MLNLRKPKPMLILAHSGANDTDWPSVVDFTRTVQRLGFSKGPANQGAGPGHTLTQGFDQATPYELLFAGRQPAGGQPDVVHEYALQAVLAHVRLLSDHDRALIAEIAALNIRSTCRWDVATGHVVLRMSLLAPQIAAQTSNREAQIQQQVAQRLGEWKTLLHAAAQIASKFEPRAKKTSPVVETEVTIQYLS
jgi:hypothetical protein